MKNALQKSVLITMLAIAGTYAVNGQSNADTGTKFTITSTAISGNNFFAGTKNNGVYLSTDSGKAWTPVNNGLPKGSEITTLVTSGNNVLAVVYKATANKYHILYLSADNGASWKEVTICPCDPSVYGLAAVYGLTVFKNKVFAGTNALPKKNKGLYQSIDNGAHWTKVTGLDTNDIVDIKATENHIIAWYYSGYPHILYSSPDGITWDRVKSDNVYMDNIEAHGNYIIAPSCRQVYNKEDYSTCRSLSISILNRNANKWDKVDLNARYFGFDGDNIYAIKVNIESNKKKEIVYEREVVKSEDRGRSWKKVDENTDPFVVADYGMQDKLQELREWEKEEIRGVEVAIRGMEINQAEAKAERDRIRRSHVYGGPYAYSSDPNSSSKSPDYRARQNDIFKEQNNHRDSWLDSKGGIHIH